MSTQILPVLVTALPEPEYVMVAAGDQSAIELRCKQYSVVRGYNVIKTMAVPYDETPPTTLYDAALNKNTRWIEYVTDRMH